MGAASAPPALPAQSGPGQFAAAAEEAALEKQLAQAVEDHRKAVQAGGEIDRNLEDALAVLAKARSLIAKQEGMLGSVGPEDRPALESALQNNRDAEAIAQRNIARLTQLKADLQNRIRGLGPQIDAARRALARKKPFAKLTPAELNRLTDRAYRELFEKRRREIEERVRKGEAAVAGEPDRWARLVHKQDGPTCAIVSQLELLKFWKVPVTVRGKDGKERSVPADEIDGRALEDRLYELAVKNGLFVGKRKGDDAGGTPNAYIDKLLVHFGMDVRMDSPSALDLYGVAEAVKGGKGVMLTVNAGRLWRNAAVSGNHAIVVTGVVEQKGTGEILGVYINDSGRIKQENRERVLLPAEWLGYAWETGSRQVVVAGPPPPSK